MATYSVYALTGAASPAAASASHGRRDPQVVFVREAFSWLALLFGPLVLLYHRLWLAFAAYAAAVVVTAIVTSLANVPETSVQVIMTGLNLLLAFELPALRGWKLTRLGYGEEGVVIAPRRELAEQRFFSAWTPRPPAPRAPLSPRPAATAESAGLAAVASVIGTFPGH